MCISFPKKWQSRGSCHLVQPPPLPPNICNWGIWDICTLVRICPLVMHFPSSPARHCRKHLLHCCDQTGLWGCFMDLPGAGTEPRAQLSIHQQFPQKNCLQREEFHLRCYSQRWGHKVAPPEDISEHQQFWQCLPWSRATHTLLARWSLLNFKKLKNNVNCFPLIKKNRNLRF